MRKKIESNSVGTSHTQESMTQSEPEESQESSEGNTVTRKVIFENCSVQQAKQVIWDEMEKYNEFIPYCKESKILTENPDRVREVRFLVSFPFKEFAAKMQLEYSGDQISWKQLEGPFESVVGHWKFVPVEKTSPTPLPPTQTHITNNNCDVHASYSVSVKIGLWIPNGLIKFVIQIALPTTLKAFKQRIEERSHQKAQHSPSTTSIA